MSKQNEFAGFIAILCLYSLFVAIPAVLVTSKCITPVTPLYSLSPSVTVPLADHERLNYGVRENGFAHERTRSFHEESKRYFVFPSCGFVGDILNWCDSTVFCVWFLHLAEDRIAESSRAV